MKIETNTIDQIVERIVQTVHPLRIILFGSAARGEMGEDSDLDLLVVMPDGIHRLQTMQDIYQSLSDISTPIDVMVSTQTDLDTHHDNIGLIYWQVLKEGKTIYVA